MQAVGCKWSLFMCILCIFSVGLQTNALQWIMHLTNISRRVVNQEKDGEDERCCMNVFLAAYMAAYSKAIRDEVFFTWQILALINVRLKAGGAGCWLQAVFVCVQPSTIFL